MGIGYMRKPVNSGLLLENVRNLLSEEGHGDT
jgi:hypothetical protein